MSDNPIARSELSPKRRAFTITSSLIAMTICFILLVTVEPARVSLENLLRAGNLLPQATATETPDPTAIPLAVPLDRPTGTQAPTLTATQDVAARPEEHSHAAPTELFTPTRMIVEGNGRCLAPCNPDKPNCLAGLTCVSSGASPSLYICWNATICVPDTPEATPDIACNFDGACDAAETASCPDCLPTWTPAEDPCSTQRCGDGVCSACPVDAGCAADCDLCSSNACGDRVCRCGEDATNCPQDCDPCSSNTCGDGMCWCGEDVTNCPQDCDPCSSNTCGDGMCRCGEDTAGCPQDCDPCSSNTCGDSVCRCGEDTASCPQDCGDPCAGSTCGDHLCRPDCGENLSNCKVDCSF